jgi:hypothetical protein
MSVKFGVAFTLIVAMLCSGRADTALTNADINRFWCIRQAIATHEWGVEHMKYFQQHYRESVENALAAVDRCYVFYPKQVTR